MLIFPRDFCGTFLGGIITRFFFCFSNLVCYVEKEMRQREGIYSEKLKKQTKNRS